MSYTADLSRQTGLRVRSYNAEGAAVIAARGPVDLATCPTLVEHINAQLAGDPAALILDFSDVTILGSAGLEVLVRTRRASTPNMHLAVVADGHGTSRVIEITGLNLIAPLHKTLDDALAEWRGVNEAESR